MLRKNDSQATRMIRPLEVDSKVQSQAYAKHQIASYQQFFSEWRLSLSDNHNYYFEFRITGDR